MEEAKRATIYFDVHVHQALRLRAAASNRSISDMVNEAVQITLAEDVDDLRDAEIQQTEEIMGLEDFIGVLRDSGRLYSHHHEFRRQRAASSLEQAEIK